MHRIDRITVWPRGLLGLVFAVLFATLASAADSVKVGFSLGLTGAVAANGRQLLAAFEIWRDDVNAKGGLLGRPVDLVYYDDQSNPATVPGIYTKLITVDKVDLLLGPYATNMVAPAMPVIIHYDRMTVSILGLGVNKQFGNYPRYFSTVPLGPDGPPAFSRGFFELAKSQSPQPKTVAILAADAEFARTAADGARANAKALGFDVVHEANYPPNTADFTPIIRVAMAANPDIVFAAAYPPDTVGIVRAAHEVGLTPKMFGGTLIGLTATPVKMQLGPLANGIIINESFVPAKTFLFAGTAAFMSKYQARALGLGIDPLGYGFAPFGYAAGQLLEDAVTATKSLDHGKLAAYLHGHTVETVVGPLTFGADGEWTKSRLLFTQFQNIDGNDLGQFRDMNKEVILWPAEYRTGDIVYPYAAAAKK